MDEEPPKVYELGGGPRVGWEPTIAIPAGEVTEEEIVPRVVVGGGAVTATLVLALHIRPYG